MAKSLKNKKVKIFESKYGTQSHLFVDNINILFIQLIQQNKQKNRIYAEFQQSINYTHGIRH